MKTNRIASLVFVCLATSATAQSEPVAKFTGDASPQNMSVLTASDRAVDLKWYSRTNNVSKEAADIYPGWRPDDWASSSYEDRQHIFSKYQSDMVLLNGEEHYAEAEANLVRMIISAYPNMNGYWNNVQIHDGLSVVQSDRIIDLNRVFIEVFEMGAYQGEEADYLSVKEEHHASKASGYNSHERMRMGLSPVGPDGLPVLLCRLNDDPRASYFELNHHLAGRLLNAIASNMTISRACLTDEIMGRYWEKRPSSL